MTWFSPIRLPSLVLIALIRAYQYLLFPLLGSCCRLSPSCSALGYLSPINYEKAAQHRLQPESP